MIYKEIEMYIEANEFYGFVKFFNDAGYYETQAHKRIYNDITAHIQSGGIYALTGSVGAGKTKLLNKIQSDLDSKKQIIVSRSLTTEKKSLTIKTLLVALFYDLLKGEKVIKIPSVSEKRERELIDLIKKHNKPVALLIDEAHDIHGLTLLGLKRLVETTASQGYRLSIIMAGHPKLGNALSTAAMEEIGARTKIFNIDDAIGDKEKYIIWLLKECLDPKKKYQEIISPEAIQKLASSLQTPLQIQHYLTQAIQSGHQLGEKIITPELIEQTLSFDLNSLEAQLARKGYQLKDTCEMLNATAKEVQDYLQGKSNSPRKNEFIQKLRSIGISI